MYYVILICITMIIIFKVFSILQVSSLKVYYKEACEDRPAVDAVFLNPSLPSISMLLQVAIRRMIQYTIIALHMYNPI